jgi:hypothetical protein
MAWVIRLGDKGHVILPKASGIRVLIDLRLPVPEGEPAGIAHEVGRKNPSIIINASRCKPLSLILP